MSSVPCSAHSIQDNFFSFLGFLLLFFYTTLLTGLVAALKFCSSRFLIIINTALDASKHNSTQEKKNNNNNIHENHENHPLCSIIHIENRDRRMGKSHDDFRCEKGKREKRNMKKNNNNLLRAHCFLLFASSFCSPFSPSPSFSAFLDDEVSSSAFSCFRPSSSCFFPSSSFAP